MHALTHKLFFVPTKINKSINKAVYKHPSLQPDSGSVRKPVTAELMEHPVTGVRAEAGAPCPHAASLPAPCQTPGDTKPGWAGATLPASTVAVFMEKNCHR